MTLDNHTQCCEAPEYTGIHDYVGAVVECESCGSEFFTLAPDCD